MANASTTLPSTYSSPMTDIGRINGWSIKYTVPYTYVAQSTASGSTDAVTVTLGTTPAGWAVNDARACVTTAFAGTTGGLAMTVGTAATVTAFIASTSVLAAGQIGSQPLYGLINATGTTATSLVAVFTNSVSGSPSGVTAGSVDIYLNLQPTATLG